MIRLKKYIFLSLFAALALSAFGADPLPAQEFLNKARNPQTASTYAKLFGTLQHRRRGQETLEMPIYFGLIIQPESTVGQIVVDNREEYMIRQNRLAGRDGISLIYNSKSILDRDGLRVSDLTMSFLYYDLVKELGGATLNAVVSCRVLLLESPPDKDGRKEYARVYLEKENAYPLRVEFLKNPDDKKPFRMMEANGFTKKKDDLYYPRTITVQGPGWRTKVEFDTEKAVLGKYDRNNPADVFLVIKK